MLNCCTSKIYKRKEKKRNPLLPVSDFIISILIFDLLPLNVIITTNFTIIKWEERALPRVEVRCALQMKHGRRQRDKARWPSRKWLKYSAAIPHRCGRRDSQREGWLLYYKPFLLLLFFLWIVSWRRLILFYFLNICCVRLCVWDEEGRTKKWNVFFLGKKKFSLKSLLSHSAWLLCWSVVKVTQAAVLHVKSENVHCQHYCHFPPPIETRLMFRFQTSVKDSRILFFMLFFLTRGDVKSGEDHGKEEKEEWGLS